MDRYVAFLRGMNLGNRRIKNEELRRHFVFLRGAAELAAIDAHEPFDSKAVTKSKGNSRSPS